MNYISFFVIIMSMFSVYPISPNMVNPNNCKSEEVVIEFRYSKPTDENYKNKIQDTLKPQISVILNNNFKDSVRVFLNDSLIFSDYCYSIRDEISKSASVNYSMSKKNPVMKIFIPKTNICIETVIQKGFRIVEVSRWKEKWYLTYSNYPNKW